MSNPIQADDPNPDNVVACFIREMMNQYMTEFPEFQDDIVDYFDSELGFQDTTGFAFDKKSTKEQTDEKVL